MAKKASSAKKNGQDIQQFPLRVCLLWHQHQPYYKTGNMFALPWAWLHATKDYLEMAQHFEQHPKMRGTINLVPSLLKQLQEYLSGVAHDPVIELLSKSVEHLTDADKDMMIERFFLANHNNVISRSARYRELYDLIEGNPEDRSEKKSRLSEQDYRDLAVHYSLAWTGEIARRTSPFAALIEKDRDYTEEDKQLLADAQLKTVKAIVPLHRRLAGSGQIELTTTPFYHPILPLLVDTDSARESMPDVSLPIRRFLAPEDADVQIRLAKDWMSKEFGLIPMGMWPSEGSVSEAALALISENGFAWTATDEGVLARSIGEESVTFGSVQIKPEHAKYFPWKFKTETGEITIFFRDHGLSDDIGFTYQLWNPVDAANDLIAQLERIRAELVGTYGAGILETAVVSIILDGENCWEYYHNNGFDFLDSLYSRLESHTAIVPKTFSDVLDDSVGVALPVLSRVVAGSWINSNFRIWIGHPEDNAAWDAVAAARLMVKQTEEKALGLSGAVRKRLEQRIALAREELLISEGSDWCWWYGDDHFSVQDHLFDELFRTHLRAVYVHLDLQVPDVLRIPIPDRTDIHTLYHRPSTDVARNSTEIPHMTGKLLNESWGGIPNVAPEKLFGAMHRSLDYELEELQAARVGEEVLLRFIFSPMIPATWVLNLRIKTEPELHIRINKNAILENHDTTIRLMRDECIELALPSHVLAGTKTLPLALEITRSKSSRMTNHPRGKEPIRIPDTGWIECPITETA